MNLEKVRQIFSIFCLTVLSFSLLFGTNTYFIGAWRFNYDAKVIDLGICQASQISNNVDPLETIQVITNTNERLFVCGVLQTSVPVRLLTIVYKDGQREPIFVDNSNEKLSTGHFHREIDLEGSSPGKYRVETYLFRQLLAASTFQIIEK